MCVSYGKLHFSHLLPGQRNNIRHYFTVVYLFHPRGWHWWARGTLRDECQARHLKLGTQSALTITLKLKDLCLAWKFF